MGWSDKYKKSINCNNPKGFSQKAHCAGRKKKENIMKLSELKRVVREILNERSINAISKSQQKKRKIRNPIGSLARGHFKKSVIIAALQRGASSRLPLAGREELDLCEGLQRRRAAAYSRPPKGNRSDRKMFYLWPFLL